MHVLLLTDRLRWRARRTRHCFVTTTSSGGSTRVQARFCSLAFTGMPAWVWVWNYVLPLRSCFMAWSQC
eukprot:15002335-Alexandrium_andersonii.AAC.1